MHMSVGGQATKSSHTFCVVYLLGVPPSPLASVHSRVTIHRTPGAATIVRATVRAAVELCPAF